MNSQTLPYNCRKVFMYVVTLKCEPNVDIVVLVRRNSTQSEQGLWVKEVCDGANSASKCER
jgi:hypothetical protein